MQNTTFVVFFVSMEIPAAILSDADGTLVDTVRLIRHGQYETSKTYLAQQGVSPHELPDYETYKKLLNQTVGTSARDTLEKTVRLLYEGQPHHLDTLDFDALHDLLNPVQDRIAPEYVKPYTGLSDLLSTIGQLGIKLAIFTSGTPHHIVRNFGLSLPETGLADYYKDASASDFEKLANFTARVREFFNLPEFTVVTCEDTTTHKPDPQGIQLAMDRLNVEPHNCIVLGDHKYDMQTGINAGVPERIGITHGFDDREELFAAGATQVIDSLVDLKDLLARQ